MLPRGVFSASIHGAVWAFFLNLCAFSCSSNSLPGAASTPASTTTGSTTAGASGETLVGQNTNDTAGARPAGAPVRFLGRTNSADPNGVRMSWPATQIVAGFTGTSLMVNLVEVDTPTYGSANTPTDNYYDIYIDSLPYKTLKLVRAVTQYQVATGLPAGAHVIRMSKRTESDMGTVQFLGFTPEAGAGLVPTPGASSRRIEFVGDSGTAGYGADANVTLANMCTFTPATERADASYAVQTGIILGADVHNISASGKGLYQNRDVVGDPNNTLIKMWTFSLGDTGIENIPWVPSQWPAQAVVAVVGGNDFFASTPDQSAYVATLVTFFKSVRAVYPDTQIFLMVSPMLRSAGSDGTPGAGPRATGIAYAQASVAQANIGDAKVYYLDTPEDMGPTYGCDQHLTTATHRRYAVLIAQAIAAKTGWTANTNATQF